MKKIFLITALTLGLFSSSIAQSNQYQQIFPHNEVNFNIANVIAIESVEFGYEHFLNYNQSVGAKILLNDRMNYHSEKGDEKFKTQSFRLNYTYYFSKEDAGAGVYVQPFIKLRTGTFQETDETTSQLVETNMNAFIIGFGLGYEWNFSNSFVISPFANIGRNFSNEVRDRFSTLEFNAGLNIGYRF